MKVDWYIHEGLLSAVMRGARISVDIKRSDNEFIAIIGRQFYADHNVWENEILIEKKDASLVELMNWAEEELKFRASHDGV